MKKLLGILVLGLLWCNASFADKWTINYFKKNLDEFKERTDLVCAGEPKEKHKKLSYLGGVGNSERLSWAHDNGSHNKDR